MLGREHISLKAESTSSFKNRGIRRGSPNGGSSIAERCAVTRRAPSECGAQGKRAVDRMGDCLLFKRYRTKPIVAYGVIARRTAFRLSRSKGVTLVSTEGRSS